MSEQESIIQIIKSVSKKCFDTETSTEAGRMNLFTGLLCVLMFIVAIATDWLDKIVSLLNKDYEAGLPPYAILVLIFMILVYFAYCIHKVSSINRCNDEEN